MTPLDRLSSYLTSLEKRLRLLAVTRGIAVTAGLALALTILAVLVINQFAFSNPSVISARVLLFLGIAFAVAAALVIPVIRLNRRHAARKAEQRHPQFEERLLTFTERAEQFPDDPFLDLLASDTLEVAQTAEPKSVAKDSWIFRLLRRRRLLRRDAHLARHRRPRLSRIRHVAVVGRNAQRRLDRQVLFHPGHTRQSHRAQALRSGDRGPPHGLHCAESAILRQVCQRLAVGTGRDGPRAGRHRLPVPDRRRARNARVLRGS